jgi:hypothetical protein
VRLLLAVGDRGYLQPFESTLIALAERGHEVTVAVDAERGTAMAEPIVERLVGRDGISFVDGVPRPDEQDLSWRLRAWADHLRYLEPGFRAPGSASHARAAQDLPEALVEADLAATADDAEYPSRLRAVLGEMEGRLPHTATADRLLDRCQPDVVIVTPLVQAAHAQVAHLRAAARRGIPRGFLVASWDSLTAGGLMHDEPDAVIVWNDAQRREATDLMAIPGERVVVTGAPGFDRWFGRQPSRDREQFCADVGLDAGAPYVLYLGSSPVIARNEAAFVARWMRGVRTSDRAALREASVLVRPHPYNAFREKDTEALSVDPLTVVHPRAGALVADDKVADDYFDSMWHADAVVGINTSGLIEAAIVGRPTLVPLTKRFREGQLGSPHFAHLLPASGGPVVAHAGADHFEALADTLESGMSDEQRDRAATFVEKFVRPFGLARSATPLVVDAIERLAATDVPIAPAAVPLEPGVIDGLDLSPAGRRWLTVDVPAPAVNVTAPASIEASELHDLLATRRRFLVPVERPLALIGQIQRSGGTLLNTLLDGHPELYAHAYELLIGHPTKFDWPALDLAASADEWHSMLREKRLARLFVEGYSKGNAGRDSRDPSRAVGPFLLPPSLLRSLFLEQSAQRRPTSQREVLDRYFTAYFNAWLDVQGLVEGPKRWISAFAPRMAWQPNRDAFFADYPDGRLLTVLRDPRPWFASARHHLPIYERLDDAMELWTRNAEELHAAKKERPEQVLLLTYDAIVTEPERTMRAVAAWLEIEWHRILLQPTYNRRPVTPNTSHDPMPGGVRIESVDRWRRELDAEDVAVIEGEPMALYERVVALADLA